MAKEIIKFLFSLGSLEWQEKYGGSGSENANSIRQTRDGGYIMVGKSTPSNGDVSDNQGFSDVWIVKLSTTTSSEDPFIKGLNISPNQTQGEINISWDECIDNQKSIKISISNSMGQYLCSQNVETNNFKFNLDDQPAGLYTIYFQQSDGKNYFSKIIKN